MRTRTLGGESRSSGQGPRKLGLAELGLAILLAVGAWWLILRRPSPPAPDLPESSGLTQTRLGDACADDNPYLATTCFVRGTSFDSEPAVVAFHDTPDDSDHVVIATVGQVGSVYGLAYDAPRGRIYASAYHKRNTHYGPLGPGGIYSVDVDSMAVGSFATVPDAGSGLHDAAGDYHPDETGRAWAGKASLGDLEFDDTGQSLLVVNLFDRHIYRYRLSDGALLGSFEHGASRERWSADARPFGLAMFEGRLFHAVVDSAESREAEGALPALRIYASEVDGTGMLEVARLALVHERPGVHVDWKAWPVEDNQGQGQQQYPHPMVTDIEFSRSGDMILGLRDRYMDTGPSVTEVFRTAPGDILRLRRTGMSRWTAASNEGTLEGEHFRGENLPQIWEELAVGGLTRLQERDVVVTTAIDPFRTYTTGGRNYPISSGAIWLDIGTGEDLSWLGEGMGREEVLYNGERHSGPQGKALGLGDFEALCSRPLRPIYLPMLERAKPCISDAYHTDVVLVLDRSTSMLRSVSEGGQAKNDAAIAAAMSFVRLLDFRPDAEGRHDQVAVVGFNDLAWIESGLSGDLDASLAALERIRGKTQEGTRLDLALEWGQKPLDSPARKPENRPVIILLTDGLPNRVPFGPGSPYPGSERQEDSVLQAADAVKQAGSKLYTVGLGNPRDILPWLLIDAASERWMYHYAPLPEDLAGIYSRIAASFDTCDPKPVATPCVPEEQHADVVLVIDLSTSMYRSTRTGRSKHEAALAAAGSFIEQLDLEPDGWGRGDRLAIVGFNDEAWTELGMSDDRSAAEAAIGRLTEKIAEGTRLDLALDEGWRALEERSAPRLQPNQPVIILLTDGLPNRVPFGPGSAHPECPSQECTVLKYATRAKEGRARLYTIGLGEQSDVLKELLERAASAPDHYYFAPDGEDLEAIYRQIAGRFGSCP